MHDYFALPPLFPYSLIMDSWYKWNINQTTGGGERSLFNPNKEDNPKLVWNFRYLYYYSVMNTFSSFRVIGMKTLSLDGLWSMILGYLEMKKLNNL